MPLPVVIPKRKKWYEKRADEVRSKRFVIGDADNNISKKNKIIMENNIDDFLKLQRWKYYKDDDFKFIRDGFLNEYKKKLTYISAVLSYQATLKLREYIEDRAYVLYTAGQSEWYVGTEMFPTVFDVMVYIKKNRLVYNIQYYYSALETDMGTKRALKVLGGGDKNTGESEYDRYKGSLPRYLSLYGIDKREDLPDILNTPVTVYHTLYDKRYKKKIRTFKKRVGRREGRWAEAFDTWFRTEGYDKFIELCEKNGLLV